MSLVRANGATYLTGANNQLLFDGVLSYSYWAEGNRTARFIDVNANGFLDAGDHRFLPASLRFRVDVCSTCSSWRLERLTGSYPSGCRLRVWVEVGRNAADGTTERACYFAATCTQLHILSPRAKWMPRCFAACGGKTSGRMRGGCGATMGPGDHTVLIAFGENAPGAVEQRAENVNVPRAGREYRCCPPLSCALAGLLGFRRRRRRQA